jgi:hypothetical protein
LYELAQTNTSLEASAINQMGLFYKVDTTKQKRTYPSINGCRLNGGTLVPARLTRYSLNMHERRRPEPYKIYATSDDTRKYHMLYT